MLVPRAPILLCVVAGVLGGCGGSDCVELAQRTEQNVGVVEATEGDKFAVLEFESTCEEDKTATVDYDEAEGPVEELEGSENFEVRANDITTIGIPILYDGTSPSGDFSIYCRFTCASADSNCPIDEEVTIRGYLDTEDGA